MAAHDRPTLASQRVELDDLLYIERLFRAHSEYLERSVRRRFSGGSVPDAVIEDACAQTWVIAWRLRQRVPAENPVAWLVVVATHEVYALLKKRRPEVAGEICDARAGEARRGDPELSLEAREALELLRELKPQQCEALALRAAGFSYAEIQELTGRTYTWVNRHLTEGRQALRAAST